MKKAQFIFLIVLFCHVFLGLARGEIGISSSQLQVKKSGLNGELLVTLAQWDTEFTDDIYYYSGPPCSPGLALPQFSAAGVAANPCWAGCNFAVKGPGCGEPFNTSEPACFDLCNNYPDRDIICADEDWIELVPDVESEMVTIGMGERTLFRMNWLRVEQGFKIEAIEFMGEIGFSGSMSYKASLLGLYCYGCNHPDPWTQICPSAQCFGYGTHFIRVANNNEQGLYDYKAIYSLIARGYQMEDTGGVRRTAPPADAPPTFPVSTTPLHVPLQFGVPVTVDYPPFVPFAVYQLTTPYCGLVSVSLEQATWNRTVCRIAVGVSTNLFRPFPADLYQDILFIDGSTKAVYICPTQPDGNATLYLFAARYTTAGEPPMSFPERHYLTVDIPRAGTDWRKYRLGSSPDDVPAPDPKEIFTRHAPFPTVGNFQSGIAANAFSIVCPDPVSPTNQTKELLCRSGSAYFGTCINFFFGYPTEKFPTSMIPIPPVIKDYDLQFFSNIDYRTQTVRGRSLSSVLVLAVEFQKSSSQFTLGENWDQILDQCKLVTGLNSPFADINGSWVMYSQALTRTQHPCDFQELQDVIGQMNAYVKEMQLDPSSAISQRVKTDLLSFQDPWQACNQFIQETLMNKNIVVDTLENTELCLGVVPGDPCCDPEASWEACCTPRDIEGNVTLLITDNITDICLNPSCDSPLLEQYSFQTAFESLGGCLDRGSQQEAGMIAYRECYSEVFGQDFTNRTCRTDSDCPNFGVDAEAKCDLVSGVCLQSFNFTRVAFFDCLAEKLPSNIRIALIQNNKWKITAQHTLAEHLAERFGSLQQCIPNTGTPWSFVNWHMGYYAFNECPLCPVLSTDPTRQIPPWCDVRYSSCTGHIWEYFTPQTECGSKLVCNWDLENCDENLLGQSFCGACETESSCYEIPGVSSSDACSNTVACFLADGTVRTDLTAQQCTQTYNCDRLCPGNVPCTDEPSCTATGWCELAESIFDAIHTTKFTVDSNPTGFCVLFEINPNNSPDCSLLFQGSIPSSYGCIVYQNCSGIAGSASLECDPYLMTAQECTSAGGKWYDQYDTTREECLATTRCSEPVTIPSLSRIGSMLLPPKNATECALCGGEIKPLSTWHPGRWLPGTSRTPAWTVRQKVPYERSSEFGIDFRTLFMELYDATVASISFQIQNNLQCTYSGSQFAILPTICDCTTSNSKSCYPLRDSFNSGRGRICPDTSVEIISYPTLIIASNDSLSSSLTDNCLDFDITRIAAQQFATLQLGEVTTGFVHRPPKNTKQNFETVENENGAIVGQVIGDAVYLEFSSLYKSLRHLEVCLAPSSSITINPKYTVFDFGYLKDSTTVVVMGFDVVESGGYLCANISYDGSESTLGYIPVARKERYQNDSNPRLSQGETALLYIVAVLYSFVFCAITIQVIRLILVGGFSIFVATNLLWLVFALLVLIRAVYFFLVPANVLGQSDQHGLVDFWMIDLPVLLYLEGSLLICLSFLFLRLGSRRPLWQDKKYFWITTGLITLFLALLFTAVILAFNFAVVDGQGIQGSVLCPVIVDNSTNAMIIRIIYECILFAIASTIALTSLILSSEITKDLPSPVILRIGISSSIGIMADSLAFLIYYIVDQPTPYFAIVLIFTEIIPIFLMLAILSTHQINQRETITSGTGSNSNGSRSNNSAGGSSHAQFSI